MKAKILLVLLIASTTFSSSLAQKEEKQKSDEIKTIFKHTKGSNGGYANLWAGYTQIDNEDGFSCGLNVSGLIAHSLGIGLAIEGFSNDYYMGHETGSNFNSLMGVYGGLLIEPIVFPRFPVHFSFPVVLGLGGVVSVKSFHWKDWDSDSYLEDSDLYLIAEPGLDIELNLLKHMRLALGAKYRFTTGTWIDGYSRSVLKGYTFSLSLKFGKF
jgi:hypothetical protein